MVMNRRRTLPFVVVATVALLVGSATRECRAEEVPFKIAKIYWEYNASANDLGVHVSLDAEDWRRLKILKPNGRSIFAVEGSVGRRGRSLPHPLDAEPQSPGAP